jgi:hypothetical protein
MWRRSAWHYDLISVGNSVSAILKIKRGGAAHGTIHPAGNPGEQFGTCRKVRKRKRYENLKELSFRLLSHRLKVFCNCLKDIP